jgi:hypothetical protein
MVEERGLGKISARDSLHRLIDELPESELAAAERFLHYLRVTADPTLWALLEAPPDDEPEPEEERQAVHEAREELARGEVRTLEEMRRELGL